MKKKLLSLLALVMTVMTASAIDAPSYNLTVGENDHGTVKFYVAETEVTKAPEGATVTVVITPNTGWVVNQTSGQWYAAIAKAPRRAQASIDMLKDIELTKLLGQDNTWSFVMERANAEISVSYKKLLTNTDITIEDITAPTYTGQAQEPVVTVKDGSTVLTLGTDYTVAYSNNTNAALANAAQNTPTVTITAVATSDKYAGETTKTFTILPKALEDGFIANIDALVYTGVAQTPEPAVTYNNMTLVKGTDFTYSYTNNVNVAAATAENAPTVTVTGKGNYTGTAQKKFDITKKALTVKADNKSVTFGDDAPQYTVSYDGFVNNETNAVLGGTLAFACSYVKNQTGAGNYDITPSGLTSSNYDITFTKGTLTVYKKHLDHPDITISNILPVTYNAQAHTPSFTVKDGSKVLVEGTDYTVSYSNNTNACDKDAAENAPTVTIKAVEGHNFYVGENSKTFTIRKKTLEDGFMSKVADLTYNGKAQEPAPTLTYDGITLVEGKDYVFSYINNKDVASTTDAKAPVVTASAVKNSNYSGAATQKFNIKKAPLTIKAADVNIIHGSEVPQYEVSYEGFVADETVAVLEGTLAVACDYTKESAVGSTYDITPSGLTAKNYDITYVAGKLTVLVNQAAVDQAAADDVMGKISAIGEVAYNETSKGLIDAAREAYNALTDAQKALVTNLETLTNAETAYANLKAAAEKAAADQLAADDVIAKITAIGEVAYNETSKGLIDAARNAYTALTEDQKALVNNYEVLTTAETTYANLKAAAEKAAADQLAAGEVIDKIIAIGEVVYTDACKALIDAARNAYSELTEDQKALVTNYEVLTVAETTYANLKAAAQQAADDQEAANEVIGKINAIGEVAYTTECKALIDAARNAYSELTADQKALVTNYEVLTTAETTYANLKAAAEKAAADKAAADDVIAKINAIGEVAYTEACKNLIDAARNAYTALTEDQKALVTNLSVLTDAEAKYAELAAIATGISTIKAIAGKTIYDMNGRKVTVPSKKGIYIVNGKKVVIK
jgi:hypothetical protein